jgi:hypothetical protein
MAFSGLSFHGRHAGQDTMDLVIKEPSLTDRHVGSPNADAAEDAWHEPGETGESARSHVPAGAEIREGHESHRVEPTASDFSYS